ncbi:Uma2 family endonuclease, partial [Dolichospermum sp. ST_sed6]|nr:Uma2 family endonuclease [Dolichospermum sp. ST_sed6]
EYWIIDPQTKSILVLELINEIYQEIGIFSGNNLVISPQFNSLNLPALQTFE